MIARCLLGAAAVLLSAAFAAPVGAASKSDGQTLAGSSASVAPSAAAAAPTGPQIAQV
jgi:hypothetical protein